MVWLFFLKLLESRKTLLNFLKLIKNLKNNIFIGKKYILRLRPCCLNLVKKKLIFFLKGFIEENGLTGE